MSLGKVTFVSFHTDDDLYERCAARLVRSLDAHGLRYRVERIPRFSSWVGACAYKARFCSELLAQSAGSICWIDADAEVVAMPTLIGEIEEARRADVAVYKPEPGSRPWNPRSRVISGLVYLRKSPAGEDLCRRWRAECERDPQTWDQVHLANVIWSGPRGEASVAFESLPPAYNFIADTMRGMCVPVVKQHQASRQVRRTMREGAVK